MRAGNSKAARPPWVIRVAQEHAGLLAPLRQLAGLKVAESDPFVWLRGPGDPETVVQTLREVPGMTLFDCLAEEQIRPAGRRIPTERLRPMCWQPLRIWFQVAMPLAALPGGEAPVVAPRLVRSEEERSAELLLTRAEVWARYAAGAPQIRLQRLSFAAAFEGEVLVRGVPLPPIPGQRFVLQDGVAVPAGFTWWPAVSAEVLRRWLRVPAGSVGVWHEDASVTRLLDEQWVAATRSAVAATRASLSSPL